MASSVVNMNHALNISMSCFVGGSDRDHCTAVALSEIDAAVKALDDLHENNDAAAIHALEAFINAVEAQRGGKISEEEADALVAAAQAIIALLTG